MMQETLHVCVGIIDMYVSQWEVPLSQLQLLGVTALLIAAKFVERFPPEVRSFYLLSIFATRNEVAAR